MSNETQHDEQRPIEGAFGTVTSTSMDGVRTWKRKLATFFAILGPGLIVMVGDNDAGGISTYAQAGQNFGYSLLWVLPLLIPVLIINQEMVVRLGAVTGVGHAKLIRERFGLQLATCSYSTSSQLQRNSLALASHLSTSEFRSTSQSQLLALPSLA